MPYDLDGKELANYLSRALSRTPPLSPVHQPQPVEVEPTKTKAQLLPANDWSDYEGNTDNDSLSSTDEGQMNIIWASTSSESCGSEANSVPCLSGADENQMEIDWASTSSDSETSSAHCDRSRKRLLEILFPSRSPSPLFSGMVDHKSIEAELAQDESKTISAGGQEDGEDRMDIDCASFVGSGLECCPFPHDPGHEGTPTHGSLGNTRVSPPAVNQATDSQPAAEIAEVEHLLVHTHESEADENLDDDEVGVEHDIATEVPLGTLSATGLDAAIHDPVRMPVLAQPQFFFDYRISTCTAESRMPTIADVGHSGVKDNTNTASVSDIPDDIGLDFVFYEPCRLPGLAYPRDKWANLIPPRTGLALSLDMDLIPSTEWYTKSHRPSTGYQGMDDDARRAWLDDVQRFATELGLGVRLGSSRIRGMFKLN